MSSLVYLSRREESCFESIPLLCCGALHLDVFVIEPWTRYTQVSHICLYAEEPSFVASPCSQPCWLLGNISLC